MSSYEKQKDNSNFEILEKLKMKWSKIKYWDFNMNLITPIWIQINFKLKYFGEFNIFWK